MSSPVYGRGGDPLRQQWGGEGMRAKRKLNQARELRQNSTPAEAKLWEQLRNRQLEGFKFLRQAPIGPYITDFLCREKSLIVELDGWTHSTSEEVLLDQKRSVYLNSEGYHVIRFANIEVMQDIDGLLKLILDELQK